MSDDLINWLLMGTQVPDFDLRLRAYDEITRLREQLAEADLRLSATEEERDAARAEALDDGLKRAAEHRATFCTAMPGTDEEFRAYLDGFDAAIRSLIKEDRT